MAYPESGPVRLRTNLADYPVTMALKRGEVSSPLVEFDFCGPKTAHNGFKGMVRENAYDAGELAIVTFLQAKAYGKPYVMLPAPISGRMQHHTIGYSNKHGEMSPKDIEGKKVGVRSYAQTTGLWARGILQHEYGVDLDKVTWLTVDEGHLAEYQDPPNTQRLPKGSKLGQMLIDGEIAAGILGNDMPDDPSIRTLIPDAKAAGKQWYERERIVPINHMFVVHQDLSRTRPDVIRELFRMVVESRAAAGEVGLLPPFGVEANRKGIELAIDWALEQRIIPRRLSVDELFDENTAGLTA
ncbi:substrate-binding domain-containing protein [Roseomonas elaeocarpi]|uniref:Phosphate ABC transporter substrate-binding protein n=1 Tax=Roseomonas elaeocarpi TaxID=907779 RepID=A0ABV6JWP8_9PROT